MDIKSELKEAGEKRAQLLQQLNQLKQQEQEVIQELLRIDGEVRLLQRLSKNGDKDSQERQ